MKRYIVPAFVIVTAEDHHEAGGKAADLLAWANADLVAKCHYDADNGAAAYLDEVNDTQEIPADYRDGDPYGIPNSYPLTDSDLVKAQALVLESRVGR